MAVRVLVTGACGLLGAHLMAGLSRRYHVVGVDRHPWWGDEPLEVLRGDLQETGVLQQAVGSVEPDVLIHCAALINVEACEQNPVAAYANHAMLTRRLIRAVPPKCLVVYISTDGVFSGDRPWSSETDLPCPRTVYGRSKVHGEWEVMQGTADHLIIRTNFYGWSSGRKSTFGEWIAHALERRQPITLFTDVLFTPMYVVDLVERLVPLIESGHRGIVHVGGKDRLSKHAFGRLLAEIGGWSAAAVSEGSVDQMPSPARRPKDTSLTSERCVRLTGYDLPEVRAGLQRFVADRDRRLSARCVALDAQGASRQ